QFSSSPFVLFLAAVMYSSWYGGRIAGLAAVAFGTWASNYFLMGPMSLAGVYQPADILRVSMFALVALLVSDVNSARSAQRRAELLSRQAQAPPKWLDEILDRMPTPLLLIDPATFRVTFANRAAQVIGRDCYPVNPGEAASLPLCSDAGGLLSAEQLPAARAARGERLEGIQIDCH